MAHHDRSKEATRLYNKLSKMPFISRALVFDDGQGEWATGERALRLHNANSHYHVVIQDDAIIGRNFYKNLHAALEKMPEKSLLSLYLGQIRPLRGSVRVAFSKASTNGDSFISHSTLLWGVCIAIPTKDIYPILKEAQRYPNDLYDVRIGRYYLNHYKKVYYTTTSIVDHNDELDSITGHKNPEVKRVAHEYSDEIQVYNKRVTQI